MLFYYSSAKLSAIVDNKCNTLCKTTYTAVLLGKQASLAMPIVLNEGNIGRSVCPGFGKPTYGASCISVLRVASGPRVKTTREGNDQESIQLSHTSYQRHQRERNTLEITRP